MSAKSKPHRRWRRFLSQGVRSLRYGYRPFYRHYGLHRMSHPVQATSDVPTIDARIPVSHAHRYLFIRVPKCANTTILTTLWLCEKGMKLSDLEAMDEKKRNSLMIRKQAMMDLFDRPSRLSRAVARAALTDYRKAIIVRNPYGRVVSAYLHKIRGNKMLAQEFGLPPGLSFAGFCDFLADGGLHADIHWMPHSRICPVPPDELDFIGHMETLGDDLERLTQLLYGCSAPVMARMSHATRADTVAHEFCGPRERQLLGELYAGDFEGFGYRVGELP